MNDAATAERWEPTLLPGTPPASRFPPKPGTYRERESRRVILGIHPSGIALIAHPGQSCGSCNHRCLSPSDESTRNHWKCDIARDHWTHGRATDVLIRWPACQRWQPRKEMP